MKTRPLITERLLMGRKESNQTNKQMNTGAKEIHQFNPCGPDQKHIISPNYLIYKFVFKLEPSLGLRSDLTEKI